jgi:hypothetical protein
LLWIWFVAGVRDLAMSPSLLVLLVLCLCICGAADVPSPSSNKPNIIIILADDLVKFYFINFNIVTYTSVYRLANYSTIGNDFWIFLNPKYEK